MNGFSERVSQGSAYSQSGPLRMKSFRGKLTFFKEPAKDWTGAADHHSEDSSIFIQPDDKIRTAKRQVLDKTVTAHTERATRRGRGQVLSHFCHWRRQNETIVDSSGPAFSGIKNCSKLFVIRMVQRESRGHHRQHASRP